MGQFESDRYFSYQHFLILLLSFYSPHRLFSNGIVESYTKKFEKSVIQITIFLLLLQTNYFIVRMVESGIEDEVSVSLLHLQKPLEKLILIVLKRATIIINLEICICPRYYEGPLCDLKKCLYGLRIKDVTGKSICRFLFTSLLYAWIKTSSVMNIAICERLQLFSGQMFL